MRAWLDELRDGVVEDHVEAVVGAGQLDAAIADLELLTAAHPLRERLWALRMIALARAGRTADALRTFADAREVLVEQAGLEPGDDLRRLEREILDGRMPTISPIAPSRPRPATVAVPRRITPSRQPCATSRSTTSTSPTAPWATPSVIS